jgi:voltage-gated potassium channel
MKKTIKIFKRETRKLFKIFSNPTFLYLTSVGNFILILTTVAVYYLEKGNPESQIKTYFDALWWGISTITTVAYGDILPQSFPGRLIGIGLMYTGTVLFISFTGVLLTTLMKEEVEEEIAPLKKGVRRGEQEDVEIEKNLREIVERLERLEKRL